MESYDWFTKRRKTKGLELAYDQMKKAFDTVTWLEKAMKSYSKRDFEGVKNYVGYLYRDEEEVDRLRTIVFKELSKGSALVADYREDLLHLVKRLDTLADHVKDAARCLEMLGETPIPKEICDKTGFMTTKLVETAQTLRSSIEKIATNPPEAISEAKKVEDIEHDLDNEYLKAKSLFVKYSKDLNCGAMVLFDDLIEFIEQAADMCADTADYILILSTKG